MPAATRTSSEPAPNSACTAVFARWNGVGQGFEVVETVLPEPVDGQVLVRVDFATICGSDLHTVTGARPGPSPSVLGHEQVGTVLAVGPGPIAGCVDGTPLAVGMRVVWSVTASCGNCTRCRRGIGQKCLHLRKYGHELLNPFHPLTGGFATHCLLLPGTAVARVPAELPDEVASPAGCATATVAAALAAAHVDATSAPGLRVLITGAGMLGLTASAMAAQVGAHVTVSDPSARRRAQARRFGAAATLDVNEQPDEVDVAIEVSGAPAAVRTCLDAVGVGGTTVLVGSVSPTQPVPMDPERIVRRLQHIVGVHNYRPPDLQRAVDFLATHHSDHPWAELVEGRFALDDLAAAFDQARRSRAARQGVVPQG